MKSPTLMLDPQTQQSNLQVDKCGSSLISICFASISVMHYHKPKHQMRVTAHMTSAQKVCFGNESCNHRLDLSYLVSGPCT